MINKRKMNITEKEKAILIAYKNNDIVSDYGWDSGESSAWVSVITQEAIEKYGLEKTISSRGIFSSLVKKGLIVTNGESFAITNKGIEVIKTLLDK